MAQLTALIVSNDEEFKRQAATMLRSSGVPVGITEMSHGTDLKALDVVVVDLRADLSSGLANIEQLRAASPGLAIFAVASVAEPDIILQTMRAGANEFFTWQAGAAQSRQIIDSFHGAVRRTSARREAAQSGARQPCTTYVFLGAKGGAGTTTVSVNCAVELARVTKKRTIIVDMKPCLGEVALFLGVRPRFTVLDAIDSLHRLDADFLRELVTRHKSGLDILAGSDQFDRPNVEDATGIEELLRVLSRTYDYVVVDAGSTINSFVVSSLYAADTVFLITNPDVPSIRNAQRLIDRVRQIGAGSERLKVLLNRASDHHLIEPRQIETALGYGINHTFPSDYRTVATALNSGVPLALTNHSEIAAQFGSFTRRLLGQEDPKAVPEKRRAFLGLL
jgi:pilus assembly protein CpaE